MEFKCAHCKKSFEETDLDDFSKKQLESFLKEIEQSLHQELEKQITNKYKEELKQFEEEKRATYLHLKKVESDIDDNDDSSGEIEGLKKRIEELKTKKKELEERIAIIEPTKKDYDKCAKEVENTKKQINESIKTIKSSLNLIKKVIIKELSYFDPTVESPFKSFLLKISGRDKVKEMTLDENHFYLEHNKKKEVFMPFSHHLGNSFIYYSSLDEINSRFHKYKYEGSMWETGIEIIAHAIFLNSIYRKLQPIVKKLERKVPIIERIVFEQRRDATYTFLYSKLGIEDYIKRKERHYVYFLDALMQKLVGECGRIHCRKAYAKIYKRKKIQEVKKIKEMLENFPIVSERIKLFNKKHNQLKKDEEFFIKKLESIKKKLEKMRF